MRGIVGPSKKRKPKHPAVKLDHALIRSLREESQIPKLDYSWRRGAETMAIPSLGGNGACTSRSIMDPVALQQESEATRAEIIAKSKRLAPAYNKGAVQYISDETDAKTIGRK